MRTVCVAVVLLAIVTGVSGLSVNAEGDGLAGGAYRTRLGGPSGPPDSLVSQPKARRDILRYAQNSPQANRQPTKFTWQATSGNPALAPFKWAGLLQIPTLKDPHLFTQCTAQFITPNVLITAAHCLKDPATPTGPWPDPATGTFMLQYQNGGSSHTFKILCGATTPMWTQTIKSWTAVEHDYAMLLVDGNSPTGHISYALDWKGRYSYAARIGYPQDILSGSFVEFAPGIIFFGDVLPFAQTQKFGGPPQMQNAVVQWGPITDATHGMSGGGWIANLNPNEIKTNNVLIAVTSSGPLEPNSEIPIFPGGTWAAYLTADEFNPLLQFVSNGCR